MRTYGERRAHVGCGDVVFRGCEVAGVKLDSREGVCGVVGVLARCGYANCSLFDVLSEGVVVDGVSVVEVVFAIAHVDEAHSITWSEDEAATLTRAVGASGWTRRTSASTSPSPRKDAINSIEYTRASIHTLQHGRNGETHTPGTGPAPSTPAILHTLPALAHQWRHTTLGRASANRTEYIVHEPQCYVDYHNH
jgi:hypothetical protein